MSINVVSFGGSNGSGGGIVVSETAPEDTNVLWIDTANGGIAKYHDGSVWRPIVAVWS